MKKKIIVEIDDNLLDMIEKSNRNIYDLLRIGCKYVDTQKTYEMISVDGVFTSNTESIKCPEKKC